ncbi:MAG TPA: hypothetical protein VKX39_17820 [Bryobacteraceae bacterium]|nr:hypothetical protein [Bryobacteraceae bacterium]
MNKIAALIKDPPPTYLFELSEAGLAYARGTETGFHRFEPGTLLPSPVEDNLLRADAILSAIGAAAPGNGSKKKRPAAVILPDYAARVSVLDFDSFPSAPEEQRSLVRFRFKKTIPFDIDSASVSYFVQPAASRKKIDVLAVIVALEVIARYEALFRGAGFHPGSITTSTLAALNLYHGSGIAVFAKLCGRALTVAVISGEAIKLFRCVTLEESSEAEILGVLYPTFAYVEDELGAPVNRLILCGLPLELARGLRCEAEPLRSRFGLPGPYDAGLLGYLESIQN